MRESFQDDLDQIGNQLVDMSNLASSAITRATIALLDADIQQAEGVIADDSVIDQIGKDIETHAFNLLALQQPVATDLRIVVTALHMAMDLERMGDLASHIAKVARLRYPAHALPETVRPLFSAMAQIAEEVVAKAGTTISAHDADRARELEVDDDAMDEKHRELFRLLLGDEWNHGVEAAVDVTLLGRYYERFADHAVAVAQRVVYLVTGEYERPAPRDAQPEIATGAEA